MGSISEQGIILCDLKIKDKRKGKKPISTTKEDKRDKTPQEIRPEK